MPIAAMQGRRYRFVGRCEWHRTPVHRGAVSAEAHEEVIAA
jgi:hypothetical protein